jgi:hypothetical protein
LILIDVDFYPKSLTYDEWQTFYSLRAAKILLLYYLAGTGRYALLIASQSFRQSGIGNFTYKGHAVKILLGLGPGLS